ncbi:MAG: hypothetical protein QOD24_2855 [Solirubrobacteraceae bacterium]|jgi:hypothetical protein|nr:hypothetical protein [Solirubrobacteraceae bacterium]
MRQPRPHPTEPAPQVALGEWRRRRLAAAGFEARLAAELTAEPAVDLHELLVLVDRGCPPPLAARILAPLDPRAAPC